jgi:hypothetical protein
MAEAIDTDVDGIAGRVTKLESAPRMVRWFRNTAHSYAPGGTGGYWGPGTMTLDTGARWTKNHDFSTWTANDYCDISKSGLYSITYGIMGGAVAPSGEVWIFVYNGAHTTQLEGFAQKELKTTTSWGMTLNSGPVYINAGESIRPCIQNIGATWNVNLSYLRIVKHSD